MGYKEIKNSGDGVGIETAWRPCHKPKPWFQILSQSGTPALYTAFLLIAGHQARSFPHQQVDGSSES